MKILKQLGILLFLSLCSKLYSQKQNNQWRFGTGGGIDFNVSPPSFVSGSAISTGEGSASVSNKLTGELLFYTDGVTVWNSQNNPMPNGIGLTGGTSLLLSSTTAAVIVPKPLDNNVFYIITIDEQFGGNGLRYSLVDMTLNGGLGDVIVGQKNISIFQTESEKLEVVPAANAQDYWIITHDNPGNTFFAFLLSTSGIQTTPVISNVGGIHSNGAGHLKVNKQFNKIACGSPFNNVMELFDFDNSTGVVSNPVTWNLTASIIGSSPLIYGVEFSPNGQYLYISNLSFIVQYDISQSNPSIIESSAYQLPTPSFGQPASIQLAPNGKIYVNNGSLDVINCPNNGGVSCGFQQNAIANQTGGGGYGLPKWVYYANDTADFNSNSIVYTDSCFGNATQFSIENTSGISSISWNFGDPASGASNTAVGLTANHTFSQVGNYNIRAILTNECGTDTLFLLALPIINCDIVNPTITGIKIVGDTCSIPSILSFQAEGLSNSPYFFWNFGDPSSGVNDTITITGTSPSPFPTHTFLSAGIYTVCVSFQEPGFPVSTVCREISIGLCCSGNIVSNDTCVQNSIPFSIETNSTIISVNWNFGDLNSGANNTSNLTNPTHVFSSPGNYNVVANITADCGTFTVNYPITIINCSSQELCIAQILIADSCFKNQTSFTLLSSDSIISVSWNFGDTQSGLSNTSNLNNPLHVFSSEGEFIVRANVNMVCGVYLAEKNIDIINCDSLKNEFNEIFVPQVFSPNGDNVNDILYVRGSIKSFTFNIFNRWGNLVFSTSDKNTGWDGKVNNIEIDPDVFVYHLKGIDDKGNEVDFKGNITLIK